MFVSIADDVGVGIQIEVEVPEQMGVKQRREAWMQEASMKVAGAHREPPNMVVWATLIIFCEDVLEICGDCLEEFRR